MSDNRLELDFTTATFDVKLKEDGKPDQDYEMRELVAEQRDAHMDLVRSRMAFDDKGNSKGVQRLEGLQADLISRCLFVKATGEKVKQSTIQKWPAHLVQKLYDAAQKHNNIGQTGKEKTDEAKND